MCGCRWPDRNKCAHRPILQHSQTQVGSRRSGLIFPPLKLFKWSWCYLTSISKKSLTISISTEENIVILQLDTVQLNPRAKHYSSNTWPHTHTQSFWASLPFLLFSAWVSHPSVACSQPHVFWLLVFPLLALIGVRYHSCLFKSSPSSLTSHWSTAPGLFRLRCVFSRIISRLERLLWIRIHNQIYWG